jgi:hypothetical protein
MRQMMCQPKQPIWPRVKGDILVFRLKIKTILTAFQPMIWISMSVNNENLAL